MKMIFKRYLTCLVGNKNQMINQTIVPIGFIATLYVLYGSGQILLWHPVASMFLIIILTIIYGFIGAIYAKSS